MQIRIFSRFLAVSMMTSATLSSCHGLDDQNHLESGTSYVLEDTIYQQNDGCLRFEYEPPGERRMTCVDEGEAETRLGFDVTTANPWNQTCQPVSSQLAADISRQWDYGASIHSSTCTGHQAYVGVDFDIPILNARALRAEVRQRRGAPIPFRITSKYNAIPYNTQMHGQMLGYAVYGINHAVWLSCGSDGSKSEVKRGTREYNNQTSWYALTDDYRIDFDGTECGADEGIHLHLTVDATKFQFTRIDYSMFRPN